MSRLTSAQVIGMGDYLEPDFDPSTLTVSQLLGVLGFHNIRYPTPYTKGKLVQLFSDEVKTRASKFKKERLKKENSQASEDGILDGVTGQPLAAKGKAPLTRRSSRRLSTQVINVEDEDSPPRPDPPKRRRSSAQPAFGGSSRRAVAPVEVTLIEESEPEEELPPKKVGRPKKKTSAGAHARRISHASGEESGWEADNNIFQSGAESSSPARASPVRPKINGPRKSRKSTSAPPQMIESSSPIRSVKLENVRSPPQSPFNPALPLFPEFKFAPPTRFQSTPLREFKPIEPTKQEPDNTLHIEETIAEETEPASQETADVASQKDSDGELDDELALAPIEDDEGLLLPGTPLEVQAHGTTNSQIIARVFAWLLIALSMYATFNYKVESSSIGYCDPGSNSSSALETILSKRTIAEACARDASPFLETPSLHNSSPQELLKTEEACPLPPLIPLPQPSSCTPCPEHAICTRHTVTCDSGYLLKPSILLSFIPVAPSQSRLMTTHAPDLSELFFKCVSAVTNGLPGFGSVGLPPRCVEDPQRKRHIGNLGKAIEATLARERGLRVCRGDHLNVSEPQEGPEEATKWGIEIGSLKEGFKEAAAPSLHPVFDDMFNEAIQQLTQWGGVFIGENSDGARYVAHKTPSMSWDCMVTVKSRELWAVWRSSVLASILMILTILGLRVRMSQKQKESRRIASFVQVALDTLRNQEMAYYSDPVSAPQPYLSSIQLRDVVLQDEHSVSERRRLWERVERVVEGNANVRANLEEIEGGDELRVWRWVGNSGRTPGRKEVES